MQATQNNPEVLVDPQKRNQKSDCDKAGVSISYDSTNKVHFSY